VVALTDDRHVGQLYELASVCSRFQRQPERLLTRWAGEIRARDSGAKS